MKKKGLITFIMAGFTLCAVAQTHIEGEEYYKADQLDNAYELLNRNYNNPGTDKSIADYYLGMISLQAKKNQDAANYFAKGISENPDYAYNYVGQGQLKLMAGDLKSAENLFKEAQKHSKKDASLEVAIARAYYDVNPIAYEKQIAKQLEKARKYDMENPDIYIFEGDQFKDEALNADQASLPSIAGKAAGKYDMAKNYDPNSTAAYVKYANLYTNFNPDYAITYLRELLSKNPDSALGQRELANAYYNKHDYVNAAKEYGKYVQNPNHFKSDENRYAFLLFYGNDYQKGYDYASQLLKENPANFTAQRYQFMNAAQLPSMKEQLLPLAESLYANHKKDLANNKFAAIDYTLVSGEFQNAGRIDDAIEVIQEGIKDLPENAQFHKDLALIYVDQGDLAKSADAYQDYLNMVDPGYNDYVQQALYAYFGGRQNIQSDPEKSKYYFDMATQAANKASEMAPNQYKPIMILGQIDIATAANDNLRKSAGQSRYEKAIQLLENSADPSKYKEDAKTIYSYLGNYYVDKNDNSKAKYYFNKYLDLAPNDTNVRDFVNKLK